MQNVFATKLNGEKSLELHRHYTVTKDHKGKVWHLKKYKWFWIEEKSKSEKS